jgi:hypothetical protein
MTEQKRRGRPPGSTKKPKEEKSLSEHANELLEKHAPGGPVDQVITALKDESTAKYQTAPMSNWAIENRKKKRGLKD